MQSGATVPAPRRLEVVSTVEALEEDLERRLLEGELAPGEHLREVELAAQYGVGRHTLRAALDRLVRRGLLESRRNCGVFVPERTAADLADLYELRVALEVQAFRALTARRHVPPAAAEAVARLRELEAGSPRRLVVDADMAFHRAVLAGTGNARLARAHADLESEIRLCLGQLVNGYASPARLAREHAGLVRAIRRGDADAAEASVRAHLERAAAWLTRSATT